MKAFMIMFLLVACFFVRAEEEKPISSCIVGIWTNDSLLFDDQPYHLYQVVRFGENDYGLLVYTAIRSNGKWTLTLGELCRGWMTSFRGDTFFRFECLTGVGNSDKKSERSAVVYRVRLQKDGTIKVRWVYSTKESKRSDAFALTETPEDLQEIMEAEQSPDYIYGDNETQFSKLEFTSSQ
ncbi:MAG: hypothetical protein PHN89_02120 [Candidatus Pacebacteria bacterium]|nr:hypothetical protein [Candidatus Paceibacterota bacterium]